MAFNNYKNLSGRSGVNSYQNKRGTLSVRFQDGSTYNYTNKSAGQYAMRRMRQLSTRGRGLNGYINRKVKSNYASKY